MTVLRRSAKEHGNPKNWARIYYEVLTKRFPPPPHLVQSEIRPWLLDTLERSTDEDHAPFKRQILSIRKVWGLE